MAENYSEIEFDTKGLDGKLDLVEAIVDSDYFGENELKILNRLSQDEEEEIRIRVAEILAFSVSQESENILIYLLRDESELVRANACDSLCKSKSLEVINLLKDRVLKDKSSLVRGYAALSISDIAGNASFDNEELSEFIRKMLKKEKVNWVKINYYKILFILGDESYLGLLLKELNNRLYRNRLIAAKILGEVLRKNNFEEIKLALNQRLKIEKAVAVRNQLEKSIKQFDNGLSHS